MIAALRKIPNPDVLAAVLGVGIVVLLFLNRNDEDTDEEGNHGGFLQDLGEDIGGAAVDLVDGVVSGAAKNIGDIVGVPRTSKTECQLAMEQGRTWDASFACSAGTFLGYVNPFK